MHAWRLFLLEKRHERGKACNDQNTFNFIRPQHVCNSFLSAVALLWEGSPWTSIFVAARLSNDESLHVPRRVSKPYS
jgi:hypothetical protein